MITNSSIVNSAIIVIATRMLFSFVFVFASVDIPLICSAKLYNVRPAELGNHLMKLFDKL